MMTTKFQVPATRGTALVKALLIWMGYILTIFLSHVINIPLMTDIPQETVMLLLLVGLAIGLFAAVALLHWWRPVGFVPMHPGSLRAMILPGLYLLMLLAIPFIIATDDSTRLTDVLSLDAIVGNLVFFMLVGITEELAFRGILFYGLRSRLGLVIAIIMTSLLFGFAHAMNAIGGQSVGETLNQVVQTAGWGVFYAALRLRLGAIIPLMVFHGLFDFALTMLRQAPALAHQAQEVAEAQATSGIQTSSWMTAAIAAGYGLVMLFFYFRNRNQYEGEEASQG
ncbi:MAG: CPBP family intramembrane metalloprotease [Anaerolineae bacterium]|nr:CPBP family intramembrane metalloprotease [Anaerolineae bacterium]MCA9891612.1 CPBP family intramembrane metalloprotease [Anaerolineae bacterium]